MARSAPRCRTRRAAPAPRRRPKTCARAWRNDQERGAREREDLRRFPIYLRYRNRRLPRSPPASAGKTITPREKTRQTTQTEAPQPSRRAQPVSCGHPILSSSRCARNKTRQRRLSPESLVERVRLDDVHLLAERRRVRELERVRLERLVGDVLEGRSGSEGGGRGGRVWWAADVVQPQQESVGDA